MSGDAWGWLGPFPVGFDLDMTLVDTRAASVCALRAAGSDLPEQLDLSRCLASASALRAELARVMPLDRVNIALRDYAMAMREEALPLLRPMPGAVEVLTTIRRHGGRCVVVTGRRATTAAAVVAALGLPIDRLVGGASGPQKVPHLRRENIAVYVGDQPSDMRAAVVAGARAIGVTTGFTPAAELAAAGAAAVLSDLSEMRLLAASLTARSDR